MSQIRILVGEMPRMLRDIIENIVAVQPDMEIVGRGAGGDVATIKAGQVDVVVVEEQWASRNLPHQQLLVDNGRLRALVVTGGGRAAHLLELRQSPILDVSPQGLVDAIRAALAPERGATGPLEPNEEE